MATELVPIPDSPMARIKEAAERQETTVEEYVRETLEQRINGQGQTVEVL